MEPSRQQAVRSDQNGWGLRLCAERFIQRTLWDTRSALMRCRPPLRHMGG